MPLSKENQDLIRAAAKEAGDHLKGKLPPCKFLKERTAQILRNVRRLLRRFDKGVDERTDHLAGRIAVNRL